MPGTWAIAAQVGALTVDLPEGAVIAWLHLQPTRDEAHPATLDAPLGLVRQVHRGRLGACRE